MGTAEQETMGKAKKPQKSRIRFVSDSGSSFLVCGCGASVACSMVMSGLHTCDHSSELESKVVKLVLAADGKTWLPEHETEMMDALLEVEQQSEKKTRRTRDESFVVADEPDSQTAAAASTEKSWVQCDSCKKWRSLPSFYASTLESLPDTWVCENMTDILYQSRLTCAQGQEPIDWEEEEEEEAADQDSKEEAASEQESSQLPAQRIEHKIELAPQDEELDEEPMATCKKSKKRQRSSFVMF